MSARSRRTKIHEKGIELLVVVLQPGICCINIKLNLLMLMHMLYVMHT